jgi:hypothetical protein
MREARALNRWRIEAAPLSPQRLAACGHGFDKLALNVLRPVVLAAIIALPDLNESGP